MSFEWGLGCIIYIKPDMIIHSFVFKLENNQQLYIECHNLTGNYKKQIDDKILDNSFNKTTKNAITATITHDFYNFEADRIKKKNF